MPLAPRRFPPVLLALALAVGCKSVDPAGAVFDSQPAGARVVIDGRDSGYATPCQIALDPDREYEVRLELDGFEPAVVHLDENSTTYGIPWSDARAYQIEARRHRFPLFLPTEDLLLPYRTSDAHSPWRVFVQLRPAPGG